VATTFGIGSKNPAGFGLGMEENSQRTIRGSVVTAASLPDWADGSRSKPMILYAEFSSGISGSDH